MKRHILIFFFYSFALGEVYCQDWKLINPQFKYNFKVDTAKYITNTIYADSVKINGTDSVFYLNRILSPCDTCTLGQNLWLLNQPQFLMRKVVKSTNGVYRFEDTLNFHINSKASLGESWVFDSSKNITASINSIFIDSVFSTTDSIKTISLSNGDTILISKNYGIIKFPANDSLSYLLEGIQGTGLGVQIPGFHEFYDFQVGDVFQYYRWDYTTWVGETMEIFKYSILEKIDFIDSIIYKVQKKGYSKNCTTPLPPNCSPYYYNTFIEIKFTNSKNDLTNKYNFESIANPVYKDTSNPYSCFGIVHLKKESDSLVSKSLGYPNQTTTFCSSLYNVYPHSEILEPKEYFFGFGQIVKTGLGDIYSGMDGFDYSSYISLMGYIKNNDTVGTIYNDSLLTENNSMLEQEERLTVFPNPSGEYLIFEPNKISQEKYLIYIYSSLGQRVKSLEIDPTYTPVSLDISDLKSGMYFISINHGKKVFFKKIFIK